MHTFANTHVLACAALMRYTSGLDTTLRRAATMAPLSSSDGAVGSAMGLSYCASWPCPR